MERSSLQSMAVVLSPRRLVLAGAGAAVVWLIASFAAPPAWAESEGTGTVLRSGSFDSMFEHPIRRRGPYEYRRQSAYGFLNLGGGVFDPASQPGSGFYGVVTGGTEMGDAMDLGLQLSWYHRGSHGERAFASYTDPAGNTVTQEIQTQSIDTDLVPLMGIVRVKFPVTSQFQPYVGGGVGYEWLVVQGTDQQGFDFSNDYAGFGAQLMAGVNVAATDMAGIYTEAVYNISTVHADFFDPTLNAMVRESLDFNGVALHGGVRVRF